MKKQARSQKAEEEMEEVGSVPWSARDFPRETQPDTLSSCVSVLCLQIGANNAFILHCGAMRAH